MWGAAARPTMARSQYTRARRRSAQWRFGERRFLAHRAAVAVFVAIEFAGLVFQRMDEAPGRAAKRFVLRRGVMIHGDGFVPVDAGFEHASDVGGTLGDRF